MYKKLLLLLLFLAENISAKRELYIMPELYTLQYKIKSLSILFAGIFKI